FLHQQVDPAQVDDTEVDGDLLAVGDRARSLSGHGAKPGLDGLDHPNTIHTDGKAVRASRAGSAWPAMSTLAGCAERRAQGRHPQAATAPRQRRAMPATASSCAAS